MCVMCLIVARKKKVLSKKDNISCSAALILILFLTVTNVSKNVIHVQQQVRFDGALSLCKSKCYSDRVMTLFTTRTRVLYMQENDRCTCLEAPKLFVPERSNLRPSDYKFLLS